MGEDNSMNKSMSLRPFFAIRIARLAGGTLSEMVVSFLWLNHIEPFAL